MDILQTPAEFRPYRSRRNTHDHNYCVAEAFCDAVTSGDVDPKTDLTYIPIFWANSYHEQSRRTGDRVFRAVPDIQKFLDDNLDPEKKYFTVMRCDDGPYETFPPNVLVFGACGRADIAIPLTTELPGQPPKAKTLLASFVGTRRTGGPTDQDQVLDHSEYNPDGVGSQVRDAMFRAFAPDAIEGSCVLKNQGGGSNWDEYSEVLSRSIFALAPRGYGRTSFRLYEAMAFGCIPVYISDRFWMPWDDEMNWGDFCLFCRPEELPDLPRKLTEISDNWVDTAQEIIQQLYPTHFSLDGTCNQIAKRLEYVR